MELVIFDLDETLLDRTKFLQRFCKWQSQFQCGLDKSHFDYHVSRFIELDQNGTAMILSNNPGNRHNKEEGS